jgi:excisionase family DNA binding protein
MPRIRKPPTSIPSVPSTALSQGAIGEVLSLAEVAAYLRLSEPEIVRLVIEQGLPGRLAGAEWRFLKTAIQQWLGQPPPRDSKEAQLAVVGSWKDDPYLETMLQEIYRKRKRPMRENDSENFLNGSKSTSDPQ